MSRMHLKDVLPLINRLFTQGTLAGQSDAGLLRRFCTGGDEAAFALLVARHGPMVLSLCRGVLRDESDAEDAFQAVFLILVRRARSIVVDESLGGWLHQVAYRVARRANAEAARRRSRERTCVALEAAEARTGTAAAPRFAALYEEIARLSESQRQVVVLCLLEGKTQTEAAAEIGCGEATIRRRLARARERLRARLGPRDAGLMVPPALPTVPAHWVAATTRIAAGPVTALARPVLAAMTRAHLVRVAAILLAFGLGTAGTVGAILAVGRVSAHAPVVKETAPVVAIEPELEQGPDLAVAVAPGREVVVPGRVIGPDGRPVAGSTVFLCGYGIEPAVRKATTGAEGRFRFTTESVLGEADADEIRWLRPRLIAIAPGFGFGLPLAGEELTLRLVADHPIEGRVTDQAGRPFANARVRVRNLYWPRRADDAVLDANKRSAAGERAPVEKVDRSQDADLSPWIEAIGRATYIDEFTRAGQKHLTPLVRLDMSGDIPGAHAPLIPPVTTGADGRFRLAGIGRERAAEIFIDGPDLASSLMVAVTRPIAKPLLIPAFAPAVKDRMANTWDDLMMFGDRVDHVAGPSRVVEGVVTDAASGAPLQGFSVVGPWRSPLEHDGDRFRSTTDALGRYRFEGLPVPSHGEFTVARPTDQPYLGRTADITIEPGPGPFKADLSVRRGVWITGRVVDDATGMPIRDSSLTYYAYSDNLTLRKDLEAGLRPLEDTSGVGADGKGMFRVAGYPGRGIVTAFAYFYLRGVGADKIVGFDGGPRAESPFYPPYRFSADNISAVIGVHIPEGAESVTCELRLKKGKSRAVRVVGPDGEPQKGTEASGLNNQIENPMTSVPEDRFTVTNLFPGEARAVVARFVPQKLMGMAAVTYEGDGPVTLRLQPWATLTGRLVDDEGRPRSRAIELNLDDGKLPLHTLGGRGYDRPDFPIDPDGRFRIEGLVAGAAYGLSAFEGGIRHSGKVVAGLVFQPGETRDLGDVKAVREGNP